MTVEESATDGRRKSPCVFARRRFGDGERDCAKLKRVFAEQHGQLVAVSVGVEPDTDTDTDLMQNVLSVRTTN